MTILGIDSSDDFISIGAYSSSGKIFSKSSDLEIRKNILHSFMAETMTDAGISISEIDGVAVAIGPGSFTGLRVGLAAAKGICWARRLPLAGVSSIEALAGCATIKADKFLVIKDARKSEFYYGGFIRRDRTLSRTMPDSVGSADDLARLAEQGYALAGPGIPALKKKDRFSIDSQDDGYERQAVGGEIARIGLGFITIGKTIDPVSAAPVYVRTPAYVKSEA